MVGASAVVGATALGVGWEPPTGLVGESDGFTRLVAEMATETVVDAWAEPAWAEPAWAAPIERAERVTGPVSVEQDQPDGDAHRRGGDQHEDQRQLGALTIAARPGRSVGAGSEGRSRIDGVGPPLASARSRDPRVVVNLRRCSCSSDILLGDPSCNTDDEPSLELRRPP